MLLLLLSVKRKTVELSGVKRGVNDGMPLVGVWNLLLAVWATVGDYVLCLYVHGVNDRLKERGEMRNLTETKRHLELSVNAPGRFGWLAHRDVVRLRAVPWC